MYGPTSNLLILGTISQEHALKIKPFRGHIKFCSNWQMLWRPSPCWKLKIEGKNIWLCFEILKIARVCKVNNKSLHVGRNWQGDSQPKVRMFVFFWFFFPPSSLLAVPLNTLPCGGLHHLPQPVVHFWTDRHHSFFFLSPIISQWKCFTTITAA